MTEKVKLTISLVVDSEKKDVQIFREWPDGRMEAGIANEATARQVKEMLGWEYDPGN